MAKSNVNPSTAHREYEMLVEKAKLTNAAFTGNVKSYVEKLEEQTELEREAYLNRAGFNNIVAPTTSELIGQLTSNAPIQSSEFIHEFSSITAFLNIIYKNILLTSRNVNLVSINADGKPKVTVYSGFDIINWSDRRVVVHDTEEVENPDNYFELIVIDLYTEHYLEFNPATGKDEYKVRQWRKGKKDTWVYEDLPQFLIRGTPIDYIPLFPANPFDSTWEVFAPPLFTQAELNIQHYRMSCDLAHYGHFMALPTLTLKGELKTYTDSEGVQSKAKIYVGSTKNVTNIEDNATLDYTEVSGSSYNMLSGEIEKIEDRCTAAGSRLVAPKAVGESADALAIRSSAETASLTTIVNAVQSQMNKTLALITEISGVNTTIELNKEFVNAADITENA